MLEKTNDNEILTFKWALEVLKNKDIVFCSPNESCDVIIEKFSFQPWAKVFKITKRNEIFYCKIPVGEFAYEASVQQYLSEKYYSVLPILAICSANNAFLTKDAGIPLRSIVNLETNVFVNIAPLYAKIQTDSINNIDHFIRIGLPDWTLKQWPKLFDKLIENAQNNIGLWDLSIEQLNKFKNTRNFLIDLCDQIYFAAGSLSTLSHGDFNDGNIFVQKNNAKIADWGESTISNPFLSVINFSENRTRRFGNKFQTDNENGLKAYAKIWEEYYHNLSLPFDFYKTISLVQKIYPMFYIFNLNRLYDACENSQIDFSKSIQPAINQWLNLADADT